MENDQYVDLKIIWKMAFNSLTNIFEFVIVLSLIQYRYAVSTHIRIEKRCNSVPRDLHTYVFCTRCKYRDERAHAECIPVHCKY